MSQLMTIITLLCNTASAAPPEGFSRAENVGDEHRWVRPSDGSYVLDDPEGLAVGATQSEDGITWQFLGPQVFPGRVDAVVGPRWIDAEPAGPVDSADALYRTVRVDSHGRRWGVLDVDAEVSGVLEAADDEMNSASGVVGAEGEEGGWYTPLSYSSYTCWTGDAVHLSNNSENRALVANPSGRQLKVVLVDQHDTLGGSCSGVLVDEDWVLTAAHCVTGSSEPVTVFKPELVCPKGNAATYGATSGCHAVDSVIVSPDYTGTTTGKPQDDYALVKLINGVVLGSQQAPMGVEFGFMLLATGTDGYMDNFPSHNLGYPKWVGGGGQACNTRNEKGPVEPFMDSGWNPPNGNVPVDVAAFLYLGTASITGWTNKRIKTDHDISSGSSGGPVYFCADSGGCASGLTEKISGLMTGFLETATAEYAGGPKVGHFRGWAQAILPNQ